MKSIVYIDPKIVDQVEEWEKYILVLNIYLEEKKSCFEGNELEEIYSKKTEFEKILKEMRGKIDDNKKKNWYFVDQDTENNLRFLRAKVCTLGKFYKRNLQE